MENRIIRQYTWDGEHDIDIQANAIYSLGVTGNPGTKLYINDNSVPLVLGPSGIFSMDFYDIGGITSVKLDNEELKDIYVGLNEKGEIFYTTPYIDVVGIDFSSDVTGDIVLTENKEEAQE